jgi:hypothetical protein
MSTVLLERAGGGGDEAIVLSGSLTVAQLQRGHYSAAFFLDLSKFFASSFSFHPAIVSSVTKVPRF